MKKVIGCFHSHHSNIELIEKALSHLQIDFVHFVDPGLDRIKKDKDFTLEKASKKIEDTLNWISSCHVDAIFITCTHFTAIMEEAQISHSLPIIKVDDSLFHSICEYSKPQILVFTNPNTVDGTMDQLFKFAKQKGKLVQVEPYFIENTFELIMQGKKQEYIKRVSNVLTQLTIDHPDKIISAAQLSMAPAAEKAEKETGIYIGHHLKALPLYGGFTLEEVKR